MNINQRFVLIIAFSSLLTKESVALPSSVLERIGEKIATVLIFKPYMALFGHRYRHRSPGVYRAQEVAEQEERVKKIADTFKQLLPEAQECLKELSNFIPRGDTFVTTRNQATKDNSVRVVYTIYQIDSISWLDQLSSQQRSKIEKLVAAVKHVCENSRVFIRSYYSPYLFGAWYHDKSVLKPDPQWESIRDTIFDQAFNFYNPNALCAIIETFNTAAQNPHIQ